MTEFSQSDFEVLLTVFKAHKDAPQMYSYHANPAFQHFPNLYNRNPWIYFIRELPEDWPEAKKSAAIKRYLPFFFTVAKNHPYLFNIKPTVVKPLLYRAGKTVLLIFLTLVCIALSVFIAIAFLLHGWVETAERWWCGERWWRALPALAGMVVGAALGTAIGLFVVAIPMIALGFSLMLSNPLVLVFLGTACTAIVLSAVGFGMGEQVTNWWYQRKSSLAMPKVEPKLEYERFELTDANKESIHAQSLKISDVELAIWLLTKKLETMPSLFHRLFTDTGKQKQAIIQQIRLLRQGETAKCMLDKHEYNLHSLANHSPIEGQGEPEQLELTDKDELLDVKGQFTLNF